MSFSKEKSDIQPVTYSSNVSDGSGEKGGFEHEAGHGPLKRQLKNRHVAMISSKSSYMHCA